MERQNRLLLNSAIFVSMGVLSSRLLDSFFVLHNSSYNHTLDSFEGYVLLLTGIGGAYVFGTGQTKLFDLLVSTKQDELEIKKGWLWAIWIFMMAAVAYMVAPNLKAHLQTSKLANVLTDNVAQWIFCVCVVIVFELGSAGAATVLAIDKKRNPATVRKNVQETSEKSRIAVLMDTILDGFIEWIRAFGKRKTAEQKRAIAIDAPVGIRPSVAAVQVERPTGVDDKKDELFDILNRERDGDLPKQKREDLYKQLGLTRTRMYELIKEWNTAQDTIKNIPVTTPAYTNGYHEAQEA